MVKININEHVKFILTEHGKNICPNIPVNKCNGESRLPLWEFCAIVGPQIYGGCIIVNNTLVIGDENEHP